MMMHDARMHKENPVFAGANAEFCQAGHDVFVGRPVTEVMKAHGAVIQVCLSG